MGHEPRDAELLPYHRRVRTIELQPITVADLSSVRAFSTTASAHTGTSQTDTSTTSLKAITLTPLPSDTNGGANEGRSSALQAAPGRGIIRNAQVSKTCQ